MSRLIISLSVVLSLVGCSEDPALPDASSPDAGSVADAGLDGDVPSDAGSSEDASSLDDSGASDAGASDAATLDAATPDAATLDAATPDDSGASDAGADASVADAGNDGGSDAGTGCHAHSFGASAVPIRSVAALSWAPSAPGGGTITPGAYDAIDAQSTGTTGMFRATWVFEGSSTLAQLQQLTLAAPGPVTPRLFSWSTAAGTLSRVETCPGADTFAQDYRVRVEGGETFLDVRQGTALMFTFQRR